MSENITAQQPFWIGLLSGVAGMSLIGCVILMVVLFNGGSIGGDGGTPTPTPTPTGNTNTNQAAVPANFTETGFKQAAQKLGINNSKFDQCLKDSKTADKVEAQYQTGVKAGVRGTPGTFINGKLVSGAVPFDSLKTEIDAILAGTQPPANTTLAPVTAADHVAGKESAPVTLIEYSDFQCPFCQRFHPTVKQVQEAYGDKVRVVYRHFPLDSIHPGARPAAIASECAADQGKFWEFADIMFGAS